MAKIGTVTVNLVTIAQPNQSQRTDQVVLEDAQIADLGSNGVAGYLPGGEFVLIPWNNIAMVEYHDERFERGGRPT